MTSSAGYGTNYAVLQMEWQRIGILYRKPVRLRVSCPPEGHRQYQAIADIVRNCLANRRSLRDHVASGRRRMPTASLASE